MSNRIFMVGLALLVALAFTGYQWGYQSFTAPIREASDAYTGSMVYGPKLTCEQAKTQFAISEISASKGLISKELLNSGYRKVVTVCTH